MTDKGIEKEHQRRNHEYCFAGDDDASTVPSIGDDATVKSKEEQRDEFDQSEGAHVQRRVRQVTKLKGRRHVSRLTTERRDKSGDVKPSVLF